MTDLIQFYNEDFNKNILVGITNSQITSVEKSNLIPIWFFALVWFSSHFLGNIKGNCNLLDGREKNNMKCMLKYGTKKIYNYYAIT